MLKDSDVFEKDKTVFAVTRTKIVSYKIKHLKENIENENYTKEEETKTGEAGKDTEATAEQYEDFSCQELVQSTIKADGSTVIQIKYKRNIVCIILDLDEGSSTTTLLEQIIDTSLFWEQSLLSVNLYLEEE